MIGKMIEPKYRTKSNGVPVLSKKEINTIADSFIWDFQPSALTNPEPLDVERLIEFYLRMTLDFQYLSHNGIYLGMTVFNDTDKVPIYDPRTERAEYISAKANTVILDRGLIDDDKQEHRLRYTEAHEAGHRIFHTKYFYRDPNQLSFLEPNTAAIIQCRTDNSSNLRRSNPKFWTDKEWMEWHANVFASTFLMPRLVVFRLFETEGRTGSSTNRIQNTIRDLVSELNVSSEAAMYRLCDLGLVDRSIAHEFVPVPPA